MYGRRGMVSLYKRMMDNKFTHLCFMYGDSLQCTLDNAHEITFFDKDHVLTRRTRDVLTGAFYSRYKNNGDNGKVDNR